MNGINEFGREIGKRGKKNREEMKMEEAEVESRRAKQKSRKHPGSILGIVYWE